jgi:iron(II)-dependent oxidoreductase
MDREHALDGILEDMALLEGASDLAALEKLVGEFEERYLGTEALPVILEIAFGVLASSAQAEVRYHAVTLLAQHLPAVWARDLILSLSIDPDDIVCMEAMRVAGHAGIDELAPYLLRTIGPPSKTIDVSVSPVGRGAAIARSALFGLLKANDTDGADALAHREAAITRGTRLTDLTSSAPQGFDEDAACAWLIANALPDDDSMVLVTGGVYVIGVEEERVPDRRFDWQRNSPPREVWLPPFLIDRFPVTVREYDAWSESALAERHIWCHPREVVSKLHRRNTTLDPRVGPTHPVTGIDWFDAAAFARAHGKDLPTEFQWEAAARGADGRLWPWGDDWRPGVVTHFGSTYRGLHASSLSAWRSALADSRGRSYPPTTTAPVDRAEVAESPCGAIDMVGNCWEWTRSELTSRGPYSPTIADRRPDPMSVVVKGGCWASLPGQLYPSFRGQDAPFCRHDEIGFRCSRQIPIVTLRTFTQCDRLTRFGGQIY